MTIDFDKLIDVWRRTSALLQFDVDGLPPDEALPDNDGTDEGKRQARIYFVQRCLDAVYAEEI